MNQSSTHAGAAPSAAPVASPAELRRTVLVAVLNNQEDFARAAQEGWYRIPQRRAPQRIGADYLAFYQTRAFKEQGLANTVTWFAPTRRYRLATRAELIPDEADHARASEYYFRIEIGAMQRLVHPVPASTWRRLTFIHTTMQRLTTACDVKDLLLDDDPYDALWHALRQNKLRPLKNRLLGDQPVDIALKARGGTLAIDCRDTLRAHETPALALPERWAHLTLSTAQMQQDMDGCLRRIGAALLSLGGSVLNA